MFKNVTDHVSQWLGVIDNTKEEETLAVDAAGEEKVVVVETQVKSSDSEQQAPESESNTDSDKKESDDLISPETKQTLEEVSAKAISTAKEWGSM